MVTWKTGSGRPGRPMLNYLNIWRWEGRNTWYGLPEKRTPRSIWPPKVGKKGETGNGIPVFHFWSNAKGGEQRRLKKHSVSESKKTLQKKEAQKKEERSSEEEVAVEEELKKRLQKLWVADYSAAEYQLTSTGSSESTETERLGCWGRKRSHRRRSYCERAYSTEAVRGGLFSSSLSGWVPADVYRKRWKYWDEKARVPRLQSYWRADNILITELSSYRPPCCL